MTSFKYNFFLTFFLTISLFAQVKIKELPYYDIREKDSLFLNKSASRQIIPLKDGWRTFLDPTENKKYSISVPANFTGTDELYFEREFEINESIINNYEIKIK